MTDTRSETSSAAVLTSSVASDGLSTEELLSALSKQRRRYALQCLCEHQPSMALADLADEVATREQDAPISEIPAETVKRVYLSLYHSHVPKLADANLVEYTQERDLVSVSIDDERVEALLELATVSE